MFQCRRDQSRPFAIRSTTKSRVKIFMPKLCRVLGAVLSSLVALSVLSTNARATTVIMLSDQELIASSRVIVTGTVHSVFSAWDDDGSTIWTYVEISPDRVLKGQVPTDLIVL